MKSKYPFGLDIPDATMPPELRRYLEQLYLHAWSAYAEAGCPFGKDDDGMLIWFEFNQQTRAS